MPNCGELLPVRAPKNPIVRPDGQLPAPPVVVVDVVVVVLLQAAAINATAPTNMTTLNLRLRRPTFDPLR
jgi:hypothetical protein